MSDRDNDNYMRVVEAISFTRWKSVLEICEETELGPKAVKVYLRDLIDDGSVEEKTVKKKTLYRYENAWEGREEEDVN